MCNESFNLAHIAFRVQKLNEFFVRPVIRSLYFILVEYKLSLTKHVPVYRKVDDWCNNKQAKPNKFGIDH